MIKTEEKFRAAISDTDILLDLYRSDAFQILDLLFYKIYIPEYIYEKELKKVAMRYKDITLADLKAKLEDENGIFEIVYESSLDITIKNIKKALVQERKDIAGRGEVECACYAQASGIQFVVSNNHTEFRFLDDIAIMLSYVHVLSICVFHNKISANDAEKLYSQVNKIKSHPSVDSFQQKLDKSWDYFCDKEYLEILKAKRF